mmetsp:Transcript_2515/g.2914  ORF Transcript_2515/g.2914 Transcript_2515/m.2914 type:complete len:240 (-) Transcript_2515:41-760(-)
MSDEILDIFGRPELGKGSKVAKETNLKVDAGSLDAKTFSNFHGNMLPDEDRMLQFVRRLHGHVAEVTCIKASSAFGIVVSGSSDGRVLVHRLDDGQLVRCLLQPKYELGPNDLSVNMSISHIEFGPISGHILVVASNGKFSVFSINGDLITQRLFSETVTAIEVLSRFSGDEIVAVGDITGKITLVYLHDLTELDSIVVNTGVPIRCITLAPDQVALLAGDEKGRLIEVQPKCTKKTVK